MDGWEGFGLGFITDLKNGVGFFASWAFLILPFFLPQTRFLSASTPVSLLSCIFDFHLWSFLRKGFPFLFSSFLPGFFSRLATTAFQLMIGLVMGASRVVGSKGLRSEEELEMMERRLE
ncbi:hypothetical protein BDP55DRAFT_642088 [Colletotrichum godetiae]|uniref:Uncharacterized protein n=1 Tax=Colletotrichum godetiae TaxID=1209918 RepID=A0AAJ0AXN2_9PEZI|nr:uncharacterized protein BDP55DRAFT_642088 [Colletotrichum godetiae]KAK1700206.1 hypothetical protein BDP55DRAFT_642088 [Colletotrichum godetiae]